VKSYPELGAPAGGTPRPSPARTRGHRAQRRATERPEHTRSRAQRVAVFGDAEHGEDGEDATLPGASTVARRYARWADRFEAINQ
jgi:hypothetical protein